MAGAGGGGRSGSGDNLVVAVRIDGAAQTLAAFKSLPKDASDELRTAALELAELLAQRVRSAGASEGRQAAKLASTVKAKRDRIPTFTVGGTKKIFRGRKDGTGREAFRGLFGSEYGGRGHGFKPHRGAAGYWIWPTVEANQADISKTWGEAADAIIEKFTEGGDPSG